MSGNIITPIEAMTLVGDFKAALERFVGQYRELQAENARMRNALEEKAAREIEKGVKP